MRRHYVHYFEEHLPISRGTYVCAWHAVPLPTVYDRTFYRTVRAFEGFRRFLRQKVMKRKPGEGFITYRGVGPEVRMEFELMRKSIGWPQKVIRHSSVEDLFQVAGYVRRGKLSLFRTSTGRTKGNPREAMA